jgi:hypothetical protein
MYIKLFYKTHTHTYIYIYIIIILVGVLVVNVSNMQNNELETMWNEGASIDKYISMAFSWRDLGKLSLTSVPAEIQNKHLWNSKC